LLEKHFFGLQYVADSPDNLVGTMRHFSLFYFVVLFANREMLHNFLIDNTGIAIHCLSFFLKQQWLNSEKQIRKQLKRM